MSTSKRNQSPVRARSPASSHLTDREIMSLFKRAVATDKRAVSRTDKAGRARRLQVDDEILKVVVNYMNGEFKICNRRKCCEKLTLSEALRALKACEDHRGKSTETMQKRRSREKDMITKKSLELWIMKHARDHGKKRARSFSDESFVPSSAASDVDREPSNAATIPHNDNHEEGVDDDPRVPNNIFGSAFDEDILSTVRSAYSNYQQIEFAGVVSILKRTGDTLQSVLNEAIASLRAKLYSTWPRIRDVEELNGIETVRNQLSYMNVYACRCWARDVTVDGYNTPSEYCGGQIIISVTEIVVLGEPGYEVRVKIGHDDDEQA